MLCCVCGYGSRYGVLWGFIGVVLRVQFVCEGCFRRPFLFFPCKRFEIPRIVLTIPLDKWLVETSR